MKHERTEVWGQMIPGNSSLGKMQYMLQEVSSVMPYAVYRVDMPLYSSTNGKQAVMATVAWEVHELQNCPPRVISGVHIQGGWAMRRAPSFGKTAWSYPTLGQARSKIEELRDSLLKGIPQ